MKVLQLLLCLLSSLGSALVFSPPVKDHTGDTVLDPQFEAKLRSLINTSMECHHIPGMTLAVVKGKFIIINFKTKIKMTYLIPRRIHTQFCLWYM